MTDKIIEPVAAQPVAWSVTWGGAHCGNFFLSETDANAHKKRMDAKHPDKARAVVPLCEYQPDRHTLQAQGKHPAPCARFCEANAFRIEERQQARLIAELEAQVTALTLDATRYRHLRSHCLCAGHGSITVFLDDRYGTGNRAKPLHLEEMDAAIDAAIAPQQNGQAEGEPT